MFNEEQTNEIQHIIDYMTKDLGMYLFGSRSMLEDMDYSSERDWDFVGQCDKDWGPKGWGPAYNWIKGEFILPYFVKSTGYNRKHKAYGGGDLDYRGVVKHKVYPHITIVLRNEADIYKHMWDGLDKEYWMTYLWKSNPKNLFAKNHPFEWKACVRQEFNRLMKEARVTFPAEGFL